MRIAFSGTHRTGKTSLLEAVAAQLRSSEVIDEPYDLLEEDGYEHADPPTMNDFQAQLVRSIEALDAAGADALFDRCPIDALAYLQAMGEELDDELVDAVRESVATLDLIVLVTIESPDRIALPAHEDAGLRRRMDEAIRALLVDGDHRFAPPVLEVSGPLADRVHQVMRAR